MVKKGTGRGTGRMLLGDFGYGFFFVLEFL